ncbi:MAG: glycosyltransferase family 4 protein [Nitrososphaeria archaeon]
MRILYITQFFDSTRGGGEVLFYSIAKQLSEKGHKVFVIRHRLHGESRYERLPHNLKVYAVNPSLEYKGGLPSTINQNLSYILNVVRLGLKIIKKENIDIIHANNYAPVFAGVILSRLTGRPIIITIHDVAFTNGLVFWKQWVEQFDAHPFLSLISYVGELLTLKLPVDAIHTVSETSRNDILSVQTKTPVFVIANGLDTKVYEIDNSEISYGDYVVYIGRCVFYKNVNTVIKAMKEVVGKNPNVKLIVVGDGPARHLWEKMAVECGVDDNVIFKGYVPYREKINILKNAAALVLPSVWEGFGLVILEAWAFKKPVIVSKVPPLTDIVEHGKDGFHVDPFNPKEWAAVLRMLLSDRALAKEMGEAGYNKLMKKFALQTTVKRLENLYIKIIRRRNTWVGTSFRN